MSEPFCHHMTLTEALGLVPCTAKPHEPTLGWCEPLCKEHYDWAKMRQPRTELRFADGHREMRNNVVYGLIYKDVETEFDGDTGNVVPVKEAWFEREEVYRDESGKAMMLFYRQIKNPTPKQVQQVNAVVRAKVTKPVSRWRKIGNRVRLWFAMRGVG